MGLLEDSETSLQVLRGFETDITDELNEIKVSESFFAFVHKRVFHVLLFIHFVLSRDLWLHQLRELPFGSQSWREDAIGIPWWYSGLSSTYFFP